MNHVDTTPCSDIPLFWTDWSPFVDGGLAGSFLDLELQVPHLTLKVEGNIDFVDSNGNVVLEVEVPEEQEVVFTDDDGPDAVNRIRITLQNPQLDSSDPDPLWDSVLYMRMRRAGHPTLENIGPDKISSMYWVLYSVKLRQGCKECSRVERQQRAMRTFSMVYPGGNMLGVPVDDFIDWRFNSSWTSPAPVLGLRQVVDPTCECIPADRRAVIEIEYALGCEGYRYDCRKFNGNYERWPNGEFRLEYSPIRKTWNKIPIIEWVVDGCWACSVENALDVTFNEWRLHDASGRDVYRGNFDILQRPPAERLSQLGSWKYGFAHSVGTPAGSSRYYTFDGRIDSRNGVFVWPMSAGQVPWDELYLTVTRFPGKDGRDEEEFPRLYSAHVRVGRDTSGASTANAFTLVPRVVEMHGLSGSTSLSLPSAAPGGQRSMSLPFANRVTLRDDVYNNWSEEDNIKYTTLWNVFQGDEMARTCPLPGDDPPDADDPCAQLMVYMEVQSRVGVETIKSFTLTQSGQEYGTADATLTVTLPETARERLINSTTGASIEPEWVEVFFPFYDNIEVSAGFLESPAGDSHAADTLQLSFTRTEVNSYDGDAAASLRIVVAEISIGFPEWSDFDDPEEQRECQWGWKDAGPWIPRGVSNYGHCRECCCWLDNPADTSEKACFDQGATVASTTPGSPLAPNDGCIVCNANRNPQIFSSWVTLYEHISNPVLECDDGEECSHSDRCDGEGFCLGTLYRTCLIADNWDGDPARDCELCDGTPPDSETGGCVVREGHYVTHTESGEKVCACKIDGELIPHGEYDPESQCRRCDVTEDTEAWTATPNDEICDPSLVPGWSLQRGASCEYDHVCQDGECVAQTYECEPLQACEIPEKGFPGVCDGTGPLSDTQGCQRRPQREGVVCAERVDDCEIEARCDGVSGSCPPRVQLSPAIFDDEGKGIRVLRADGTEEDEDIPASPSLASVTANFNNFRTGCGKNVVRMGVIRDGACDRSRVDETPWGWGSDFPLRTRGTSGVAADEVQLELAADTLLVRPVVEDTDPPPIFLDLPYMNNRSEWVNVTGFGIPVDGDGLRSLLWPGCNCIPDLVVALDIKLLGFWKLTGGSFVDVFGGRVAFEWDTAPLVNNDEWYRVEAAVADSAQDDFDWSELVGMEIWRSGYEDDIEVNSTDATPAGAIKNVIARANMLDPCTRMWLYQDEETNTMTICEDTGDPTAGCSTTSAPADVSGAATSEKQSFDIVTIVPAFLRNSSFPERRDSWSLPLTLKFEVEAPNPTVQTQAGSGALFTEPTYGKIYGATLYDDDEYGNELFFAPEGGAADVLIDEWTVVSLLFNPDSDEELAEALTTGSAVLSNFSQLVLHGWIPYVDPSALSLGSVSLQWKTRNVVLTSDGGTCAPYETLLPERQCIGAGCVLPYPDQPAILHLTGTNCIEGRRDGRASLVIAPPDVEQSGSDGLTLGICGTPEDADDLACTPSPFSCPGLISEGSELWCVPQGLELVIDFSYDEDAAIALAKFPDFFEFGEREWCQGSDGEGDHYFEDCYEDENWRIDTYNSNHLRVNVSFALKNATSGLSAEVPHTVVIPVPSSQLANVSNPRLWNYFGAGYLTESGPDFCHENTWDQPGVGLLDMSDEANWPAETAQYGSVSLLNVRFRADTEGVVLDGIDPLTCDSTQSGAEAPPSTMLLEEEVVLRGHDFTDVLTEAPPGFYDPPPPAPVGDVVDEECGDIDVSRGSRLPVQRVSDVRPQSDLSSPEVVLPRTMAVDDDAGFSLLGASSGGVQQICVDGCVFPAVNDGGWVLDEMTVSDLSIVALQPTVIARSQSNGNELWSFTISGSAAVDEDDLVVEDYNGQRYNYLNSWSLTGRSTAVLAASNRCSLEGQEGGMWGVDISADGQYGVAAGWVCNDAANAAVDAEDAAGNAFTITNNGAEDAILTVFTTVDGAALHLDSLVLPGDAAGNDGLLSASFGDGVIAVSGYSGAFSPVNAREGDLEVSSNGGVSVAAQLQSFARGGTGVVRLLAFSPESPDNILSELWTVQVTPHASVPPEALEQEASSSCSLYCDPRAPFLYFARVTSTVVAGDAVFVAGWTNYKSDFGGVVIEAPTVPEDEYDAHSVVAFVARIDAETGTIEWVRNFGVGNLAVGDDKQRAVAIMTRPNQLGVSANGESLIVGLTAQGHVYTSLSGSDGSDVELVHAQEDPDAGRNQVSDAIVVRVSAADGAYDGWTFASSSVATFVSNGAPSGFEGSTILSLAPGPDAGRDSVVVVYSGTSVHRIFLNGHLVDSVDSTFDWELSSDGGGTKVVSDGAWDDVLPGYVVVAELAGSSSPQLVGFTMMRPAELGLDIDNGGFHCGSYGGPFNGQLHSAPASATPEVSRGPYVRDQMAYNAIFNRYSAALAVHADGTTSLATTWSGSVAFGGHVRGGAQDDFVSTADVWPQHKLLAVFGESTAIPGFSFPPATVTCETEESCDPPVPDVAYYAACREAMAAKEVKFDTGAGGFRQFSSGLLSVQSEETAGVATAVAAAVGATYDVVAFNFVGTVDFGAGEVSTGSPEVPEGALVVQDKAGDVLHVIRVSAAAGVDLFNPGDPQKVAISDVHAEAGGKRIYAALQVYYPNGDPYHSEDNPDAVSGSGQVSYSLRGDVGGTNIWTATAGFYPGGVDSFMLRVDGESGNPSYFTSLGSDFTDLDHPSGDLHVTHLATKGAYDDDGMLYAAASATSSIQWASANIKSPNAGSQTRDFLEDRTVTAILSQETREPSSNVEKDMIWVMSANPGQEVLPTALARYDDASVLALGLSVHDSAAYVYLRNEAYYSASLEGHMDATASESASIDEVASWTHHIILVSDRNDDGEFRMVGTLSLSRRSTVSDLVFAGGTLLIGGEFGNPAPACSDDTPCSDVEAADGSTMNGDDADDSIPQFDAGVGDVGHTLATTDRLYFLGPSQDAEDAYQEGVVEPSGSETSAFVAALDGVAAALNAGESKAVNATLSVRWASVASCGGSLCSVESLAAAADADVVVAAHTFRGSLSLPAADPWPSARPSLTGVSLSGEDSDTLRVAVAQYSLCDSADGVRAAGMVSDVDVLGAPPTDGDDSVGSAAAVSLALDGSVVTLAASRTGALKPLDQLTGEALTGASLGFDAPSQAGELPVIASLRGPASASGIRPTALLAAGGGVRGENVAGGTDGVSNMVVAVGSRSVFTGLTVRGGVDAAVLTSGASRDTPPMSTGRVAGTVAEGAYASLIAARDKTTGVPSFGVVFSGDGAETGLTEERVTDVAASAGGEVVCFASTVARAGAKGRLFERGYLDTGSGSDSAAATYMALTACYIDDGSAEALRGTPTPDVEAPDYPINGFACGPSMWCYNFNYAPAPRTSGVTSLTSGGVAHDFSGGVDLSFDGRVAFACGSTEGAAPSLVRVSQPEQSVSEHVSFPPDSWSATTLASADGRAGSTRMCTLSATLLPHASGGAEWVAAEDDFVVLFGADGDPASTEASCHATSVVASPSVSHVWVGGSFSGDSLPFEDAGLAASSDAADASHVVPFVARRDIAGQAFDFAVEFGWSGDDVANSDGILAETLSVQYSNATGVVFAVGRFFTASASVTSITDETTEDDSNAPVTMSALRAGGDSSAGSEACWVAAVDDTASPPQLLWLRTLSSDGADVHCGGSAATPVGVRIAVTAKSTVFVGDAEGATTSAVAVDGSVGVAAVIGLDALTGELEVSSALLDETSPSVAFDIDVSSDGASAVVAGAFSGSTVTSVHLPGVEVSADPLGVAPESAESTGFFEMQMAPQFPEVEVSNVGGGEASGPEPCCAPSFAVNSLVRFAENASSIAETCALCAGEYTISMEIRSELSSMQVTGGTWTKEDGVGFSFTFSSLQIAALKEGRGKWMKIDVPLLQDQGKLLRDGNTTAEDVELLEIVRLYHSGDTQIPLDAQFEMVGPHDALVKATPYWSIRDVRVYQDTPDCTGCGTVMLHPDVRRYGLGLMPEQPSDDSGRRLLEEFVAEQGAVHHHSEGGRPQDVFPRNMLQQTQRGRKLQMLDPSGIAGLYMLQPARLGYDTWPPYETIERGRTDVTVDLAGLYNPMCECLAGAEVVGQVRLVGEEDVTIAGAVLTTRFDGGEDARVYAVDAVTGPVDPVTGYAEFRAPISVHANSSALDLRFVNSFALLASDAYIQSWNSELGRYPVVDVKSLRVERSCGSSTTIPLANPQKVGNVVRLQRTSLDLVAGDKYKVLTYETNHDGQEGPDICSEAFIADNSPPVTSEDAAALDLSTKTGASTTDDVDAVGFTDVLRVTWSGTIEDPESAPDDILFYKIGAVLDADGHPVPGEVESDEAEFTIVNTGADYVETKPGKPPLEHGVTYHPVLHVTNRAGLTLELMTDGATFDETAPVAVAPGILEVETSVADRNDTDDIDYQQETAKIRVTWAGFEDPESGVTQVDIGLQDDSGGEEIAFTTLSEQEVEDGVWEFLATELDGSPSSFVEGFVYKAAFKVQNDVALATLTSDGIAVDTSAPAWAWKVDIFPHDAIGEDPLYDEETPTSGGDVDLHDGASVFRVKMSCSDDQSGGDAITYRFRVCNAADCTGTYVSVWSDWSASASQTTALPLSDADLNDAGSTTPASGETLYAAVECRNGALLSTADITDGVTVDDSTVDVSGTVVNDVDPDGVDTSDVDGHDSSVLEAAWQGFVVQGGSASIAYYEWAVGTSAGNDNVLSFTSTGLTTEGSQNVLPDGSDIDEGHYFVSVRATSTAGGQATVSSDGVYVDFTAPVFGIVADVASSGVDLCPDATSSQCEALVGETEDIDAQAQSEKLTVLLYNETEDIGGIVDVSWSISTCDDPSAGNVQTMTSLGDPDARELSAAGLSLTQGLAYCSVVRVTNMAGLSRDFASNGVVVDRTPPTLTAVNDGHVQGADADGWAALSSLTGNIECSDAESSIVHYRAKVVELDDDGAEVGTVADWVDVGDTTPFTLTGLSLQHQQRYAIHAACYNGAGVYEEGVSDGFIVDSTAPSDEFAFVHHSHYPLTVSYQASNDTIRAHWGGFADPETHIAGFAWSISSNSSAFGDILSLTDTGAATVGTATGLQLQDGQSYFVLVEAYNYVGDTVTTMSTGVTIDHSEPPSGAVVVDGTEETHDAVYVTSTDSLTLHWPSLVDPDTPTTFQVAIGSVPYGEQQLGYTNVGNATSFTARDVSLALGTVYYATIISTNAAGGTHVSVSKRVAVDTVPPTVGIVYDGPTPELSSSVTDNPEQLFCSWRGFKDYVGGIKEFRVGFGTTPGATDFMPFTRVGPDLQHVLFFDLRYPLVPGVRYYCTVKVIDVAGFSASASSAGQTTDPSPPRVGTVYDAPKGSLDVDSQTASDLLYASWEGFREAETWIDHFEVGVVNLTDVDPYVLGNYTAAVELYESFNETGTESQFAENPFPWPGDDPSGIRKERFQWIVNWTRVASHLRDFTFEGLNLAVNTTYHVGVRAYNPLSLHSESWSDGVLIVPPGQGAAPTVDASSGVAYADDLAPLGATAHVRFVQSVPTEDQRWCGCAAAGAIFRPDTGCSCSPGTFLDVDADTGAPSCAPCPTGTCKYSISNDLSECSADYCGEDGTLDTTAFPPEQADEPPLGAAGDTPCGSPPIASVAVQTVFDDNGECVCPPGSYLAGSPPVCVACHADAYKPAPGNLASECSVCWAPGDPDVVLDVQWSLDDVTGPVGAVTLTVDVARSTTRWVFTPEEDGRMHISSRVSDVSFPQGGKLFVRVRVQDEDEVVIAEEVVETELIDHSPPSVGTVILGSRVVPQTLLTTRCPSSGDGEDGEGGSDDCDYGDREVVVTGSWRDFTERDGGIDHYEVALGGGFDDEDDDADAEWQVVEPWNATRLTPARLASAPSQGSYGYLRVRAYNRAGLYSEARSEPALVFDDVPSGTVVIRGDDPVFDATPFPHRAAPVQRGTSVLRAAWKWDAADTPGQDELQLTYHWEAVDFSTGEVLTVTQAGADNETETTFANGTTLARRVVIDNLDLQSGGRYAVRVTAETERGGTATVESLPVLVDATPPANGTVTILPEHVDNLAPLVDEDMMALGVAGETYQTSAQRISAAWSFDDAEGDIESAVVTIGGIVGGGYLMVNAFAEGSSGTFDGLTLLRGECYIVNVRVTTTTGYESESVASDPLCVDTTLPAGSIDFSFDGSNAAPAARLLAARAASRRAAIAEEDGVVFVAGEGQVTLQLVAQDVDSAIGGVRVALSTNAELDAGEDTPDVADWVSVPFDDLDFEGAAQVDVGGADYADFPDGETVYAYAQLFNGMGLPTLTRSSYATEVDASPPAVLEWEPRTGFQAGEDLVFDFEFEEPESAIVGYVWSVWEEQPPSAEAFPDEAASVAGRSFDRVLIGPVSLGDALVARAAADGLDLVLGARYVVEVTACNVVGLCTAVNSTFAIDNSPPVAGIVVMGTPDADDVWSGAAEQRIVGLSTDEGADLTRDVFDISWSPFVDNLSGISRYELSLGTAPLGTQLSDSQNPLVVEEVAGASVPLLDVLDADALSSGAFDHGTSVYASVTAVSGGGLRTTVSAHVADIDNVAPRVAYSIGVAGDSSGHSAPGLSRSMIDPATDLPIEDAAGAENFGFFGLHGTLSAGGIDSDGDGVITVTWSPFADEGGISHYRVDIYEIGSGSPLDSASVGSVSDVAAPASRADVSVEGLEPDVAYLVAVTATDNAGNEVTALASSPMRVDTDGPMLGRVSDGSTAGRDISCMARLGDASDDALLAAAQQGGPTLYANATGFAVVVDDPEAALPRVNPETGGDVLYTVVGANWEPPRDVESGILSTVVGLGTAPGLDDVAAFTAVQDGALQARFVIPLQQEGRVLFATVRAENGRGVWSQASSDGIRMLCDPEIDQACLFDGAFLCMGMGAPAMQ